MPRAKVKPEERQRVERACQSCKSSKKRCDGQEPCGLCVKQNRAEACTYGQAGARSARRGPYPQREHRRSLGGSSGANDEDPSNQGEGMVEGLGEEQSQHAVGRIGSGEDARVSPGEPSHTTSSQMMLNSKGETVYVGATALLSFLHFLRQVLRQHIGPSNFTEAIANVMLEAKSPETASCNMAEDPELQHNYIQYFLASTSGIMGFYSSEDINQLLLTPFSSPQSMQRVDNLLAMAIGAQSRNMRSDSSYASTYFERGRRLAFEDMLEYPSLSMVRSFLLMSFYMLGACQRNAACLYLGIAAKSASIVGLHDDVQNGTLSESEKQARRRTWQSLRVMDILVNSILGRPTSFGTIPTSRDSKAQEKSSLTPVSTLLDASSQLCTLLEQSLLSSKPDVLAEVDRVDHTLQEIRQRMNTLPRQFRIIKVSDLESLQPDELARTIGNIHIAATYYFSVILVTRPYLISTIITKLANEQTGNLGTNGTRSYPQMAEACIDAAMFLASMSLNAQKSGLLLANMCILKAWLFLSGLVLGFAICTQVDERPEVELAFNGARDVLRMLSAASPQAREYYEILGHFAEAIRRYREQSTHDRAHYSKKYVDQVLSFETGASVEPRESYLTPPAGPSVSAAYEPFEPANNLTSFASMDSALADDFDLSDISQFASHISDFFPLDYDSLGLDFG